MEWLKQLLMTALKGKVDEAKFDEAVNTLVDSTKKEMGKHMIPKEEFNSKNDELKSTKAEMDKLQKQIEDLSKSGEEKEKLQTKLTELDTQFKAYKADAEKRETNSKKAAAIEKGLRAANASQDALDLLIGQFDLEKITLDSKGNIVDWDDHLKPVKETRKTLFAETKTKGNPPANPPQNGGGGNATKQQLIDKYNEAEKRRDVASMIAIDRQIKEFKEE